MSPAENSTNKSNTNSLDEMLPWAQMAESLYDFLNRRKTTIEYAFEDLEIAVPKNTGDKPERALWKLNGAGRLRTWEA